MPILRTGWHPYPTEGMKCGVGLFLRQTGRKAVSTPVFSLGGNDFQTIQPSLTYSADSHFMRPKGVPSKGTAETHRWGRRPPIWAGGMHCVRLYAVRTRRGRAPGTPLPLKDSKSAIQIKAPLLSICGTVNKRGSSISKIICTQKVRNQECYHLEEHNVNREGNTPVQGKK